MALADLFAVAPILLKFKADLPRAKTPHPYRGTGLYETSRPAWQVKQREADDRDPARVEEHW